MPIGEGDNEPDTEDWLSFLEPVALLEGNTGDDRDGSDAENRESMATAFGKEGDARLESSNPVKEPLHGEMKKEGSAFPPHGTSAKAETPIMGSSQQVATDNTFIQECIGQGDGGLTTQAEIAHSSTASQRTTCPIGDEKPVEAGPEEAKRTEDPTGSALALCADDLHPACDLSNFGSKG